MDDLLGFVGIFLVCLITLIVGMRWPGVSKILFVALTLRIFTLLIGNYAITLPDSTADASSIENHARIIAENGFFNLLDYYPGPSFAFIRWLIAIPYSLFGPSELMAKSMSLFFGMGSVFLGWKLACKLWDSQVATKVGWVIALFPSLILYSSLTMRSVYICFFLLVAIYGVVNWAQTKKFSSICLALIGFISATFFHGASIIGAFTFIAILTLISFKDFFELLKRFHLSSKNLFLISLFVGVILFYFSNEINVPYLNDFKFISDPDVLLRRTRVSVMGEAAYPDWTIAKYPIELIYKIPIRSIYFMFAPFPWDVKQVEHIVGMFDGFLFMYLVFLILSNIKFIWENFTLRIIFLILISYLIVFGTGVGNFGTGIRHRSKFAIIFILLAAPLLKNFILLKKIRKNK